MKALGILGFVVSIGIGYSQPVSKNTATGLFMSKDDYMNNAVAFKHVTDSLNTMYIGSDGEITIVRAGRESQVRRETIYGFYYHGSKYRAYSSPEKVLSVVGYFKLEDEDAICVYSQYGYLKTAETEFYFFSRTADSPIHRLTLKNLEKEFPLNPDFHNSLKENKLHLTEKKGQHMLVNSIVRKYIQVNN